MTWKWYGNSEMNRRTAQPGNCLERWLVHQLCFFSPISSSLSYNMLFAWASLSWKFALFCHKDHSWFFFFLWNFQIKLFWVSLLTSQLPWLPNRTHYQPKFPPQFRLASRTRQVCLILQVAATNSLKLFRSLFVWPAKIFSQKLIKIELNETSQ